MTDKEKTIKELKEALDSLDITNKYRLNLIRAIEYLQEESVSKDKDFEMALAEMVAKAQKCVVEPWVVAAQWKDCLIELAKSEEHVSEDLEKYINELSKQFPEVSFAKLSRIAVRVAKWQKEQMTTKVIDGKVIANGMGNPILHLFDKGRHLIGKKVKVIIIKKD